MRNYVIINGVNSNTINGLAINELPPITKPPMRVLQEEIDGRDGDITTNLGYGAYDKVMTIGLFHTFDINQIIAFFNGSGTIVFSNEPDKKYNYKIIEQIDYEKLISFKTATVTLHCQPFKYPLEETPLIIEPTTETLENVTSASIETDENTLSTTLKGNTSQASEPTPTNPQPINVVTGDNNIVICGKNLFAFNVTTIDKTSTYRATATQRLTITGTDNVNEVKFTYTSGSYNRGYFEINGIDGTLDYSISFNVKQNTTSYTPVGAKDTENSTSDKLVFYISGQNGSTTGNTGQYFILNNIMLEYGTSSSPYEPYQSQNYEINLGKNLINYNDFTTYGTTTITDETISVANNTESSISGISLILTGVLKAGKYTFKNYSASNGGLYVMHSSSDYSHSISAGNSYTFDYDGTSYLRILGGNISAGDTKTYQMQLEKGTQATSYSAYFTPIELNKIGDYQDYLYKDNGSWYIHKEIGKYTFDGTENGGSLVDSNKRIMFSSYNIPTLSNVYIDKPSTVINITPSLTNYFSLTNQDSITQTNNKFAFSEWSGTKYIYFSAIYDNVNDFKTWLSTHNTKVYYVLATPTNTIITDTTLISQLEALKGANSYYGVTNINQDNSDLPFMLDITYFEKDTNKVVVNNIGNIYSKPTLALEGNGTGGIYLNDNQILSVELTDKMTISISDMEAFDPDTHALLNRNVTGNYNSMTLQPNENTIKITGGITKATITDYTRYL